MVPAACAAAYENCGCFLVRRSRRCNDRCPLHEAQELVLAPVSIVFCLAADMVEHDQAAGTCGLGTGGGASGDGDA